MRPRTALEAAPIRRSQPLPHISDRDRCVNAIRFACEDSPLQIWIGLLSFPSHCLPLPFTSVGRSSPFHSHTFLLSLIPSSAFVSSSSSSPSKQTKVCMCVVVPVCMCASCNLSRSKFWYSNTRFNPILSCACWGYTLCSSFAFGYWRDGNWGLRFSEAI